MLNTTTNSYLLDGLKRPDNEAIWREYVNRYRPLIVSYAHKLGFRAGDAEDVAQETLLEFSKSYGEGKYDRDRGRLRHWLFGIAHHQVHRARRKRRPEVPIGDGKGVPERVESREQLEELWEAEWRRAVICQCLAEVRHEFQPKTVQAFQRFALEGVPAEKVARELGIQPNTVFSGKHRVLRRIRELIPLMEDVY